MMDASARPKKIGLFAMGGTIAMRQQADGGAAPSDDAQALLGSALLDPGIMVECHDILCKPSASIDLADVATLVRAIEDAAEREFTGIVVTHGTDTIEETAFALGLMLAGNIPVILTGAMRSADSVGADGPANLIAAITVAAHPQARNRGPLVVFADEIHAGHLVHKVHSSRTHAFSSAPFGPVGMVVENRVRFEMMTEVLPPRLKLGATVPAVAILQAGMNLEPETIRAFDTPSIAALVIAGVGGGHISERATLELEGLAQKIPVIMTSKVGMGPTLRDSYSYVGGDVDLRRRGILNGGRWTASQARILVQLCLSDGVQIETLLE